MSEPNFTNRYKLILLLGGKCRICLVDSPEKLELDHIYNDGEVERAKHGSAEIYSFYLEHIDRAFQRLQPLCKNCHEAKHNLFVFIPDYQPKNPSNLPPNPTIEKMQLFMDVMKSLEGDEKRPVEEKTFVKELVKTGKFTEDEARKYIKKLQRESAIYESALGCYSRV